MCAFYNIYENSVNQEISIRNKYDAPQILHISETLSGKEPNINKFQTRSLIQTTFMRSLIPVISMHDVFCTAINFITKGEICRCVYSNRRTTLQFLYTTISFELCAFVCAFHFASSMKKIDCNLRE